MNLPGDHHKAGFLQAIKRFNVTEKELENGFWRAYADHYTPSSGIEFRHIYKHVQKMRNGEDQTIDEIVAAIWEDRQAEDNAND